MTPDSGRECGPGVGDASVEPYGVWYLTLCAALRLTYPI